MNMKIIVISVVIFFNLFVNSFAQDTIRYEQLLDKALSDNLYLKNELLNIDLAKG